MLIEYESAMDLSSENFEKPVLKQRLTPQFLPDEHRRRQVANIDYEPHSDAILARGRSQFVLPARCQSMLDDTRCEVMKPIDVDFDGRPICAVCRDMIDGCYPSIN